MVDLSGVILTWNSEKYISKCLTSLAKNLSDSGVSHELFVIDNGSTDSTLALLHQLQSDGLPLTVIPLGSNTGTTFSRNIGLKMAHGKYICVLDSDIELHERGTVAGLIKTLESVPDSGIVAPALKYSSGNLQKSVDKFPTLLTKVKRFFFLKHMEKMEKRKTLTPGAVIEVDYAISAFWVFRRTLIDVVGLFDTHIFYSPEDVDYCLRCWLKGFSVLYDSSQCAIHHAQEISRKSPLSRAGRSHLKGLFYLYKKHGYMFSLKKVYKKIERSKLLNVAGKSRRAEN
jgi:GT2 family glycosyltransferase